MVFVNLLLVFLLRERMEGNMFFNVIGVDFVGFVKYCGKCKEE